MSEESTDMITVMVTDMIRKIDQLKAMKSKIYSERKEAMNKVKRTYETKINKIEKDIYNVENAGKMMATAKVFHQIRRDHNAKQEFEKRKAAAEAKQLKIEQEKAKDINTADTNNNIDNNNNNI